ncbi:helix-turn-helix domain-containing protein [Rothia nasimurium]|uniref:helix-turn-helix domain-containing protein n=1 Tax=Rothia nasimurium TaxID=85336 RepID=UPI003BA18EC6
MDTKIDISTEVGLNVRAELARSGQSITGAAQALDLSAPAFRRRLKGQVPFNVHELDQLAALLGIAYEQLVNPVR